MGDVGEIDRRIGEQLRQLRQERGLTLDVLASQSGVSRATLSRLEKGEVSATAQVLGRLCPVYGITVSRLLHSVEHEAASLLPSAQQPVWHDRRNGYVRRSVSPPAPGFAGEVLQCEIASGREISYTRPPRPGIEHHFLVLEGELLFVSEGARYQLREGDSLRIKLFGETRFVTPAHCGARYMLFIV